jgi:hypothetical protein
MYQSNYGILLVYIHKIRSESSSVFGKCKNLRKSYSLYKKNNGIKLLVSYLPIFWSTGSEAIKNQSIATDYSIQNMYKVCFLLTWTIPIKIKS